MSAGLWGAIGGAGLGALEYGAKKKQNESDRRIAAETARWSPWTGMKPQEVAAAPSALGMMGQGALGGFDFGSKLGGGAEAAPVAPAEEAAMAAPAPMTLAEDQGAAPVMYGSGGAMMSPASGYGKPRNFSSYG